MNAKKFIIITVSIVLICLGYYFRLFFFPLQILSIREIEQNQQGICLAENRKLSEQELLNRGMQSYFQYLQTLKVPLNEDRITMIDNCPESCGVTQLAASNLIDYLKLNELNYLNKQKGKRIKPQGEQIRFFKPIELSQYVQFGNKQKNQFSLYINQTRLDRFYPNDCCEVNPLSYFTSNGFTLDNMPKSWRSTGKGNFYLNIKYLVMDAGSGYEITLQYETVPLDNCGTIYNEYFHNTTEDRDFKNPNITDSNVFWYYTKKSIVPKEKLDTNCILLDNQTIFPQFYDQYRFVSYNDKPYLCTPTWDK